MMTQNAPFAMIDNFQRELDQPLPLGEKLSHIHQALNNHSTLVHRIALALYAPETDHVSTFLYSSAEDAALFNYSVKLSAVRSLSEIARHGVPRVINDLAALTEGKSWHTQKMLAMGYQSSLTYPLYCNGSLFGFLFFNSYRKDAFTSSLLHLIDLFSQIIAALAIKETSMARTITAAMRTTQSITRHKDEETSAHLGRMSHFSRLIATALAQRHGFGDECVEALIGNVGKIMEIQASFADSNESEAQPEVKAAARHTQESCVKKAELCT